MTTPACPACGSRQTRPVESAWPWPFSVRWVYECWSCTTVFYSCPEVEAARAAGVGHPVLDADGREIGWVVK